MGKSNMQSVRIYNHTGNGSFGTQCEINGNKVEGVLGVDFHVSTNEVPTFVFEMQGISDIDMNGEVQFQFTPKTVQDAAAVIQREIHPSSDYFKAMAASVEETLRMYLSDYKEIAKKYLPEDAEIVAITIAEDIVRKILEI